MSSYEQYLMLTYKVTIPLYLRVKRIFLTYSITIPLYLSLKIVLLTFKVVK